MPNSDTSYKAVILLLALVQAFPEIRKGEWWSLNVVIAVLVFVVTVAFVLFSGRASDRNSVLPPTLPTPPAPQQRKTPTEEELSEGVFINGIGPSPDLNLHEEIMTAYPVRLKISNSHGFPIYLTQIATDTLLDGKNLGEFNKALSERFEIPARAEREHICSVPLTAKDVLFIKKCGSTNPRFAVTGSFYFDTPHQTRFFKRASGEYTSIVVNRAP